MCKKKKVMDDMHCDPRTMQKERRKACEQIMSAGWFGTVENPGGVNGTKSQIWDCFIR